MIALDLDRGSRVGLALAGFLAPVALGMVLRLAGAVGVVEEAMAPLQAVRVCDARRLDAACDDGELCAAGVCRHYGAPVRSAEGKSCGDSLLCEPGLECQQGACRAIKDLRIADAVCREPETRAALDRLVSQCAAKRPSGKGAGSLGLCEAWQWEEIARSDYHFDRRLLKLPGAFAVFFPTGEPQEGGRFPSPTQRQHYVARMRAEDRFMAAMAGARVVMAVGRASVTGEPVKNLALAQRRAQVAVSLVSEALGRDPRVLEFGLADAFRLPADEMGRFLAAPMVAGAEEAARLGASFAARESGYAADLDAGNLLNQVALVVAFPCDGTEFFPVSAYYEPMNAR